MQWKNNSLCKSQCGADRLADNLINDGVPVGALHGEKSQVART
jgi:superfamily II DNA/RNA helicase